MNTTNNAANVSVDTDALKAQMELLKAQLKLQREADRDARKAAKVLAAKQKEEDKAAKKAEREQTKAEKLAAKKAERELLKAERRALRMATREEKLAAKKAERAAARELARAVKAEKLAALVASLTAQIVESGLKATTVVRLVKGALKDAGHDSDAPEADDEAAQAAADEAAVQAELDAEEFAPLQFGHFIGQRRHEGHLAVVIHRADVFQQELGFHSAGRAGEHRALALEQLAIGFRVAALAEIQTEAFLVHAQHARDDEAAAVVGKNGHRLAVAGQRTQMMNDVSGRDGGEPSELFLLCGAFGGRLATGGCSHDNGLGR